MMKMYLVTVFVLLLSANFIYGDRDKHLQAEFRAALAKAKTLEDALIIIKTAGQDGAMTLVSYDSLKAEEQTILRTAQELNTNSHRAMVPRNGVCEPRVVCEPVPVDRTSSDNIIPFPQCLEVHRCGGCCQDPQFPCVAIQEEPVTFSPVLSVIWNGTARYHINGTLTLMNHTECQCKCSKTQAECHREGKKLDPVLCQCTKPQCKPECLSSSECSMVHNLDIPRCKCRREIFGQKSSYCPNLNQRPDYMCRRCETILG